MLWLLGLMPHDEKMRDVMQAQDNLYTVVITGQTLKLTEAIPTLACIIA
jgi:hypothetical protein